MPPTPPFNTGRRNRQYLSIESGFFYAQGQRGTGTQEAAYGLPTPGKLLSLPLGRVMLKHRIYFVLETDSPVYAVKGAVILKWKGTERLRIPVIVDSTTNGFLIYPAATTAPAAENQITVKSPVSNSLLFPVPLTFDGSCDEITFEAATFDIQSTDYRIWFFLAALSKAEAEVAE